MICSTTCAILALDTSEQVSSVSWALKGSGDLVICTPYTLTTALVILTKRKSTTQKANGTSTPCHSIAGVVGADWAGADACVDCPPISVNVAVIVVLFRLVSAYCHSLNPLSRERTMPAPSSQTKLEFDLLV